MSDPLRVALVTGTSSGIGKAAASELLRRDWRVVGLSRRDASFGDRRYTHVSADLTDVSHIDAMIRAAVGHLVTDSRLARLGLVNNAADPGILGPVAELSPAAMLAVYALNLVAPTALMGWFVAHGPGRVPLRIVNVSSGADSTPMPGMAPYCGTKAALRMTGRVLATELDRVAHSDRDVTVLSYVPGTVDTAMQEHARTAPMETFPLKDMFAGWKREGRLIDPNVPAAEIVDYLEDDGYPSFHEAGVGGVRKPDRRS